MSGHWFWALPNNDCVVAIGCAVMTSAGAPLSQTMSLDNDSLSTSDGLARSAFTHAYTNLPNSNLDQDFYTSQQLRGLELSTSTGKRLLLRELINRIVNSYSYWYSLFTDSSAALSMFGSWHDTVCLSVCLFVCYAVLCAQGQCKGCVWKFENYISFS